MVNVNMAVLLYCMLHVRSTQSEITSRLIIIIIAIVTLVNLAWLWLCLANPFHTLMTMRFTLAMLCCALRCVCVVLCVKELRFYVMMIIQYADTFFLENMCMDVYARMHIMIMNEGGFDSVQRVFVSC